VVRAQLSRKHRAHEEEATYKKRGKTSSKITKRLAPCQLTLWNPQYHAETRNHRNRQEQIELLTSPECNTHTWPLLEEEGEVLGAHGLLRRGGALLADDLGGGRAHGGGAFGILIVRRRVTVCEEWPVD